MDVKTVYTPRGTNGVMFLLMIDGKTIYKWNPNGKANEFQLSSRNEFEQYQIESRDVWWNPIVRSWGSWRDLERSLKDAGKKV